MAISTTNLISVWELKEASGNALDSFGSNTLTDNNTVGAATGKIVGARSFNGSNEYFNIADNSSLSWTDIDFTICAWVYPTAPNNFVHQGIVTKGDNNSGSTEEYCFRLNGFNGKPAFSVRASIGTVGTVEHSTALSANTWAWLYCEHQATGNQLAVAINNGTAATASYSSGGRDQSANVAIGCFNGGTANGFFSGRIEQVAIFKRLLTSGEKGEIYNSGNGLPYSSWAGGGGGGGGALGRNNHNVLRAVYSGGVI